MGALTAPDHAVDRILDQEDGGQHVGVERPDPGVAVPIAEIPWRRTAGVVDQYIGIGTGGEDGGAAFRRGHVDGDGGDVDAGGVADLPGGGLQGLRIAPVESDMHAFARQRHRAGTPQTLARGAHQRALALQSQIHVVPRL